MVNKERIVTELLQLVKIDCISKNERKMADYIWKKLNDLEIDAKEDNSGEKIGGNTGNIIALLKGNINKDPILLSAHMDTVMPGLGKKPIVKDNIVKSDGSTILGADDAAGITIIFEILNVIKENKLPHGDIYILFTVAEEMGLMGSNNLCIDGINAKYGFVLDDYGPAGGVTCYAPAHKQINVNIKGKSVHSGIEPEEGVSAIQIFADAVSRMRLGRIDFETTANIGVIKGGTSMNVVCDLVEVLGEVRSRDINKLERQTEHMRECFYDAAEKFGGHIEFKNELLYQPINFRMNHPLIGLLKNAMEENEIAFNSKTSGGGSDANLLNSYGIPGLTP